MQIALSCQHGVVVNTHILTRTHTHKRHRTRMHNSSLSHTRNNIHMRTRMAHTDQWNTQIL